VFRIYFINSPGREAIPLVARYGAVCLGHEETAP
jgi:hypothetical protein